MIVTGDLVAIIVLFSIFIYMLVIFPIPSIKYWSSMIKFIFFIIFIRFFLNLPLFCTHLTESGQYVPVVYPYCDSDPTYFIESVQILKLFGITMNELNNANYIVFEILMILSLQLYLSYLKHIGLYQYYDNLSNLYNTYTQDNGIEHHYFDLENNLGDVNIQDDKIQSDNQSNFKKKIYDLYDSFIHFYKLDLPYIDVDDDRPPLKIGCNYSKSGFIILFLTVIYTFFSFGTISSTHFSGEIENPFLTNQFSLTTVLGIIYLTTYLSIDYYIFLAQDIRLKFLIHVIHFLYIHIFCFLYIPLSTSRSFQDNPLLIIYYLLSILYLYISAMQIYNGYKTNLLDIYFVNDYTKYRYYKYLIYVNIPFVFDIALYLQYMAINTSLTFDVFYKTEQILSKLYMSTCNIKFRNQDEYYKLSKRRPFIAKIGQFVLLVAALVIIIIPIFFFSTGNPSLGQNDITGAKVSFSVNTNTYNFDLLYQNQIRKSRTISLSNLQDIISPQTIYFNSKISIQEVIMDPFSEYIWSMTPIAKVNLINNLRNSTIQELLSVTTTFYRNFPEAIKELSTSFSIPLPLDLSFKLADIIEMGRNESITISNFFPLIFHLSSSEDINTPLTDSLNTNLSISYQCSDNNTCWWSSSNSNGNQDLKIYVVNDNIVVGTLGKLLSIINGGTILALYTLIILYFSKLYHSLIFYEPWEVMFTEIENPQTIIDIGEGIYFNRYSKTHDSVSDEKKLVRYLLEIYKSPMTLYGLTMTKYKDE